MLAGSFRIFRVFGINVYIHWTWLILAFIVFKFRGGPGGTAPIWGLLTWLSIFGIVLLHEFGHALATRSVGGRAENIVLWPLGGVAFVEPPPRPGAVLWAIAAGPLVNVILIPITMVAMMLAGGAPEILPDGNISIGTTPVQNLLGAVVMINLIILAFNMLPIYPLDGGQILQALLWFFIGRARNLRIAAGIGIAAAVVGGTLAILTGETMLIFIALFIGWQAWNGYRVARLMAERERAILAGLAGPPPGEHPKD